MLRTERQAVALAVRLTRYTLALSSAGGLLVSLPGFFPGGSRGAGSARLGAAAGRDPTVESKRNQGRLTLDRVYNRTRVRAAAAGARDELLRRQNGTGAVVAVYTPWSPLQ